MIEADRIDEFLPSENWRKRTRQRSRELFLKFASILNSSETANSSGNLPITLEESRFLIALNMRLNLAETIIASQKQLQQGVLKNNPAAFNKNALWAEVFSLSFKDYLTKSVLPWYQKKNPDYPADFLIKQSNLYALEESLKKKSESTGFSE